MISFIAIGRNEGWKLTKCLHGIFNTIKHYNLNNYEVIYVDSNSTDDSIKRALEFSELSIIKLTGTYNAAIARNIGAEKSSGNVLFFIDGDMEILPKFLPQVYDFKDGLKYSFVSGQLKNYNYNNTNTFINNSWQYKGVLKGDKYYSTTGGIFLIKRELWFLVNGMDSRFERGQDLELALRLAQKGHKILRKKEVIANHYTILYSHHSRIWKTLLSGNIAYSNSFLLRKHFLNPFVYSKTARNYYTLLSLFCFGTLALLFQNILFLMGYLIVLLLKTYKAKPRSILKYPELIIYYIVRDFSFLLFLFVPLKKISPSKINYELIQ